MAVTSSPTTSPQSTDIEQGVALWKRKQVTGMLFLGGLLFLSAGTLSWPLGWLYVVIYGLTIIAQVVVVLPRSPGLLAERAKLQAGTKRWDVILLGVGMGFATIATLVVAGLDYRNGWTAPLPLGSVAASALVMAVGWGIIIWAMASNPFFSATVRIQTDRNQQVMTGGPYKFVRHPGYIGAILYNAVTPIVLGSLWALIPTVIIVLMFIVRTAIEDPTLQHELPGYREYAQRTRYRLLPGVW